MVVLTDFLKDVANRVRQMVALYSNDCMGIGLVDSALAVLDEWSSYRGDRINIFDCNFVLSLLTFSWVFTNVSDKMSLFLTNLNFLFHLLFSLPP